MVRVSVPWSMHQRHIFELRPVFTDVAEHLAWAAVRAGGSHLLADAAVEQGGVPELHEARDALVDPRPRRVVLERRGAPQRRALLDRQHNVRAQEERAGDVGRGGRVAVPRERAGLRGQQDGARRAGRPRAVVDGGLQRLRVEGRAIA